MKIEITVTDLLGTCEDWPRYRSVTWAQNGSFVNRSTLIVSDDISDRGLARAVLASVGYTGIAKRSDWCNADCGSWRAGTIGIFADAIPDEPANT